MFRAVRRIKNYKMNLFDFIAGHFVVGNYDQIFELQEKNLSLSLLETSCSFPYQHRHVLIYTDQLSFKKIYISVFFLILFFKKKWAG